MASRGDSGVITIRLKPDAYAIYRRLAPPRTILGGALVSRLLFEHAAREEERLRQREAQCKKCGGGCKS
jgi:hypothetical protein